MKRLFLCASSVFSLTVTAQNVGINNASPQLPLDILKTGGGNLVRLLNPSSSTGATSGILFTNSASYNPPGFSSASLVAQRKTLGGQDLIFSTSPTNGAPLERMRLDSAGNLLVNNGNIGLGTVSPSYDVYIRRNAPSIGLYDDAADVSSGTITGDSADLIIAAYRKNQFAANRAGNLLLQVNSTGLPFTAGNVGIGTYSPNAKLHIASNVMIGSGYPATGYLLSVNGKIMSEEVRVELDADWPDYVFKNSYRLPSLSQVENFIRTNGHLSNMPSAKQVKVEGFELGEMNRKLLEKVEELTLYLIQQKKEIAVLQQEVKSLKRSQPKR